MDSWNGLLTIEFIYKANFIMNNLNNKKLNNEISTNTCNDVVMDYNNIYLFNDCFFWDNLFVLPKMDMDNYWSIISYRNNYYSYK